MTVVKNLRPEDIARLVTPCKNRNVELTDNKDGSIVMKHGSTSEDLKVLWVGTMKDAEDWLEKLDRKD